MPAALSERIPPARTELRARRADTLSLLKTRNACLDADQFFELISLCLAQDGAYRHLKEHRLEAKELFALIEEDPPLPQIPKAIDAVFDPHRTVRSSASKELSDIRSSLSRKRTAADRIFYRVRQKLASKGLLGDIDESVHDNRRVLAVQAGYKSQVNGIFHGSSNKHSLYYMEPSECIAINNEIAQLIDQERKEVQRILRQLTSEMALYQPQLERYRDLLIRLDVVRAKAQFGKRFDCIVPRVNREGRTCLIEARNPVLLLHNQRKSKPTVPCSLELDPSSRLLVISGPNAGGKSIALKTVGLIQCMLQWYSRSPRSGIGGGFRGRPFGRYRRQPIHRKRIVHLQFAFGENENLSRAGRCQCTLVDR